MRLIAVVTCHSYEYPKQDSGAAHHSRIDTVRSSAIRRTWHNDWLRHKDEIDLKFFYGRGERSPEADEVFLDVPDDYYSLPIKVKAVFQWALDHHYDFCLKVDDDVFVWVDRLIRNYPSDDYRGFMLEASEGKYASGTAYWLSRKAMEVVVKAEWNPADFAEDKYVGRTLAYNGINLAHDDGFQCCNCPGCMSRYSEENRISLHTTSPEEMVALHKANNRV
jgi:hypothetical protein